jgi:hypothetical protein
MGNIVSDPNDNQLILNSRLRDIISDWAKNDYDAGLSWKKITIDGLTAIKLKNVLRKRACCTRQTVMNVALPIIDLNASGSNVIKPGYSPVNIRVFRENEFNINPNACKLLDESKPNEPVGIDYLQTFSTDNFNLAPGCSSLYPSGGINLGLCKKIKIENMKTYNNDPLQSAYGYYASDRLVQSENSIDTYNNYTDCNCENSILRDVKLPSTLGYTNINNREVFVQSNDSYCFSCSSNGRCFVSSKVASNTVCINIAEVKESIAESSGSINNIQTCEANNNLNNPDIDESSLNPSFAGSYGQPTTTSSKVPTNPDIIVQAPNSNTAIIAISVLIGILIIALVFIIFRLYKKKNIENTDYTEGADTNVNTDINTVENTEGIKQ